MRHKNYGIVKEDNKLLIPVINILTKYNIFEIISLEDKQSFSKILRAYSIIMEASLFVYSSQEYNQKLSNKICILSTKRCKTFQND